MMLNKLFDVLRGWPREGAIDETFPAHVTAGTPDALPAGTVVTIQSDGSMAAATTPNLSTTDPLPVWVVVEGNDDFSGTFLEKVVCLRMNAELKLDPANFSAGSYNPGTLLSFSGGKFEVAATNNQVIGEVISNNTADGTLTIFYNGGIAAKK